MICVCVCVKVKVYVTWKRENHLRLYLRADISKDNNEKRNNHGIRTEFRKVFFSSSNTSKDTSKHRLPAVKKYNPINKKDQYVNGVRINHPDNRIFQGCNFDLVGFGV